MGENFRVLAERRLREARALYAVSEWSGAYYLAGYSVECALKACALKSIRRYHMPEKDFVKNLHTHDLQQLVGHAGLNPSRQVLEASNPLFRANWATVKDWSEESRYGTATQQEADDLLQAITQRGSGVLGWIKKHW